jgi:hypothetical protein
MTLLLHVVYFYPTVQRSKYIQYYTTICIDRIYMWNPLNGKKSLTWGGGHQCKARTSLCFGPMLKIDCPLSTIYWPHPFPQLAPFFLFPTRHAQTSNTISTNEDNIGKLEAFPAIPSDRVAFQAALPL